jgi:hypothetical protein
MNPYLVVVAVGLVILNITFLIGLRVSPPRPGGVGAPVELTAVQ